MIIVGIDSAKRIHSASIVHQSGEVRGNATSPFTVQAKGLKNSFSMLNVIMANFSAAKAEKLQCTCRIKVKISSSLAKADNNPVNKKPHL